MTAIIKSEFLKATTSRSTYVSAIILTGIAALAAGIFMAPIAAGRWLAISDHPFLPLYITVIGLAAFAFGVRAMTDEYRFGTILSTFLATPDRLTVLAGKVVSASIVAAIATSLASMATFGRILPWAATTDLVDFGIADALLFTGFLVSAAALFAALGVGVAAIVRHPVASMVGGLGWFAVIEPAIAEYVGDWMRFLPGRAAASLVVGDGAAHTFGMTTEMALTRWEGLAVFGGYAILALILGGGALQQRDV